MSRPGAGRPPGEPARPDRDFGPLGGLEDDFHFWEMSRRRTQEQEARGQAVIDEGYRALGVELDAAVAPAGQAWRATVLQDPTIALWQDDGSHPTGAGTYLVAATLYSALFGPIPDGIGANDGLPADIADRLRERAR